MKTETEINKAITEIKSSGIPLDAHMIGYVKALEWVLKDEIIVNDEA